jgi:hypothetical protein
MLAQSGQRNYRGYDRSGSDKPGGMPLARGILDQPRIAGSEASYRSIAEPDFEFTRYQDDVLPSRRGMPVDECAARLLSKYYMLCCLRLS